MNARHAAAGLNNYEILIEGGEFIFQHLALIFFSAPKTSISGEET